MPILHNRICPANKRLANTLPPMTRSHIVANLASMETLNDKWKQGLVPEAVVIKPIVRRSSPRIPPGPDRLVRLFHHFANCATAQELDGLKRYLIFKWMPTESFTASLGTFCSGTDSPILVMKAFKKFCSQRLGIDIDFIHAFSSENTDAKQKYLLDLFPDMQALYPDVKTLGKKMAKNLKTGLDEEIKSVTAAFGGFPCQDASGLNPNSSSEENRSCVSQDSWVLCSVIHSCITFAVG